MTIKSILPILLLLPFFSLKAQDVASDPISPNPLVFESVSFSSEQGSLTITCEDKTLLTEFEVISKDAHFAFTWDGRSPADRFPMRLHLKPGEVTVKYKMQGEKGNFMQFNLANGEHLKINLKKSKSPKGVSTT